MDNWEQLQQAALTGRMTRRDFISRAAALGIGPAFIGIWPLIQEDNPDPDSCLTERPRPATA